MIISENGCQLLVQIRSYTLKKDGHWDSTKCKFVYSMNSPFIANLGHPLWGWQSMHDLASLMRKGRPIRIIIVLLCTSIVPSRLLLFSISTYNTTSNYPWSGGVRILNGGGGGLPGGKNSIWGANAGRRKKNPHFLAIDTPFSANGAYSRSPKPENRVKRPPYHASPLLLLRYISRWSK